MSEGPVRLRGGGLAADECNPGPPATLDRALLDLRQRRAALERDPENAELHDACDAALTHVARLTGELRLSPEMRKHTRRYVLEMARWLSSMPVARRRSPGG